MAIKDSIGGWKKNAFFGKFNNACAKLKDFMGDIWIPFLFGLGMKNITQCPIPQVC